MTAQPVTCHYRRVGPRVRVDTRHGAAAGRSRSRYLLNWVETRTWSSVGVGVYLALHDKGFDVKVPPALEHAFGSGRTALDHEVDEKVTVVADEDLALGWEPPAGAVRSTRTTNR